MVDTQAILNSTSITSSLLGQSKPDYSDVTARALERKRKNLRSRLTEVDTELEKRKKEREPGEGKPPRKKDIGGRVEPQEGAGWTKLYKDLQAIFKDKAVARGNTWVLPVNTFYIGFCWESGGECQSPECGLKLDISPAKEKFDEIYRALYDKWMNFESQYTGGNNRVHKVLGLSENRNWKRHYTIAELLASQSGGTK